MRILGVTKEFSLSDKVIYLSMIIWTLGWSLTFIFGTIYNLSFNQLSSEEWKSCGNYAEPTSSCIFRNCTYGSQLEELKIQSFYLKKSLALIKVDKNDDGMV